MSLRARLIAILGATASFAIALALVIQDRTLASDLQHAAAERLVHSAVAANRLVDAHLAAVADRYRAISSTPQLRANLEVEDPPTLEHYAHDLHAQRDPSAHFAGRSRRRGREREREREDEPARSGHRLPSRRSSRLRLHP